MNNDPLWFKNAIIYQLHVKGFYDQNGDGIGDFRGLTEKLDYVESLGITALWLLPFYPSPLKDDGYDIANFMDVHSDYGTLDDFQMLLSAAHERGIRVITELVLNHTSDQHDWFQRARHAPKGSSLRNFYIWSETPDRFKDARIIFKDFESSNWAWDPVAKAYYFHRFYSQQPDLNYENPLVHKQIFRTVDFWLEMGVDGLRLDAVPYLFKKEGSSCENLPETHEFVQALRKHVDAKFKDRVLIAEANQWPEDAAAYFGSGNECHMAFHFPLMPRMFMAIQIEDRFPIIDILEQTPVLPEPCQWILFLRNHDELTLEMVSDVERDYMYKFYAKDPKARLNLGIRRRLAPLLENDKAKIELMNALLLSLPGTPVLYYGDEIGMGDNYFLGDRNGVRTPMQWNADRNAGFSRANPQKLYLPLIIDPASHYEIVNVESQEQNHSSLLWWLRRTIFARRSHRAFGLGTFELIATTNPKILAFTRSYEDESILVVANLSRFSQATVLDLSKYAGLEPHEIFNQNPFPAIRDTPYPITLGPYGYYWLSLKHTPVLMQPKGESEIAKIIVKGSWKNLFKGKAKQHLEHEALPKFLQKARWFEHKELAIRQVKIQTLIPFAKSLLSIVTVHYKDKEESDSYFIPFSYAVKSEADARMQRIAITHDGVLYDSIEDPTFQKALVTVLVQNRRGKSLYPHARSGLKKEAEELTAKPLFGEQSNSAIVYGHTFFLKLYRRLEEGIHPEVELAHFLTEKVQFPHIARYAGSLALKPSHEKRVHIALLENYIENEGSAWDITLDTLTSFYEDVQSLKVAKDIKELLSAQFVEQVELLGQRTAAMHLALGSRADDPDFRPEPISFLHQRSLYQDLRSSVKTIFRQLKNASSFLPDEQRLVAIQVSALEDELIDFFKRIIQKPFTLMKCRIHGDYHLEQLLYTGKDFVITDFEGEPLYPFDVRRRKHTVLRDIAGMIRSFHYAAYKALTVPKLAPWADAWCLHVTDLFLRSYVKHMRLANSPLLPKDAADSAYLLKVLVLEKALYELGYELHVRPDWIMMPCKGFLFHLNHTFEECITQAFSSS